jgi:hypothetical protein
MTKGTGPQASIDKSIVFASACAPAPLIGWVLWLIATPRWPGATRPRMWSRNSEGSLRTAERRLCRRLRSAVSFGKTRPVVRLTELILRSGLRLTLRLMVSAKVSAGRDGRHATAAVCRVPSDLVPGVGIEPTRPCGPGILSPVRLPVSPPRLSGPNHRFYRMDRAEPVARSSSPAPADSGTTG